MFETENTWSKLGTQVLLLCGINADILLYTWSKLQTGVIIEWS